MWQSCPLVFIASACTLVTELIAGRIMAPYVGVSLYTSTRTTALDEERLRAYLTSGYALTRSDDFAPVDQLLARLLSSGVTRPFDDFMTARDFT